MNPNTATNEDLRFREVLVRTYKLLLPDLVENYPRFDPYPIVSLVSFTPIESNVWGYIRSAGLPFLPQFPAEQYFLDFADPVKMIGIEVDGKAYHQDQEKDEKRQKALESKGWKIFRITGQATFFERYDFEDLDRDGLPFLMFRMGSSIYNCSAEEAIFKLKEEYYKDIYKDFPKRDFMRINNLLSYALDRLEKRIDRKISGNFVIPVKTARLR